MKFTSWNICYLLWKRGIPRVDWAKTLARWVGCDWQRASDLLFGKCSANEDELQEISRRTGYSADELLGELLQQDGINVLQENIAFLLKSFPHGKMQKIAEILGVNQKTLSRWRNKEGEKGPRKSNLEKLTQELSLPPDTNLEKDPLFLYPSPVGAEEQKAWLRMRINEIHPDYLMRIFPALEKLLEE